MDRHCARLCEFLIPFRAHCGAQFCVRAFSDSRSTCVTTLIGSRANNCQSFIRHGGGACVTESMSVLTDPATCGILSSELTNCPRTAAVLGELAQWQQMMGTLQRFEQEAVSSQNTADAIENPSRTRSDVTGSRLRLKDGEGLDPKSWSGNTPLGGLAREVAAWLGYVHPKHEAGKWIQQITKGSLRATEAWTDGRYAEDDKHVELDYELAVAHANVTEGAARATVLKVTQTEPSHEPVAWQALVDGYAPKSSNDPAIAPQPILATPKRCKDAKELMNGRAAGGTMEARKEARRAPRQQTRLVQ